MSARLAAVDTPVGRYETGRVRVFEHPRRISGARFSLVALVVAALLPAGCSGAARTAGSCALPPPGSGTPDIASDAGAASLAFVGPEGRRGSAIYTVRADGTRIRLIAENQQEQFFRFSWAPTGERMWFGYGRAIRSVEADGSGLTELAGHVKGDGSISWSPDGTRIAYERWRAAYAPDEIWTADVDRPANQIDLTQDAGPDSGPLWSPDGSLIAFQRRAGRGRWDLWVRAANGTCVRRLTHAAGRKDDAVDYSWSPDGERLAFFQNKGLFVVGRDGADRHAVAADLAYLRQASWSPDGGKLLIVAGHYQEDFELYAADAGGGAITRLTANDRLEDGPVWSPDGSSIAFMTTSPTGFELHSVDLAGNERRLTHGFGDYFPAWSPDGTKIAFSREESPEGHADIWVMDANGGDEINLTGSMPRYHYYTQFEWRPRP